MKGFPYLIQNGERDNGEKKERRGQDRRERERESVLTSLSLCGVVFYFLLNPFFFSSFLFLFSLLVGGGLNVLISKKEN